MKKNTSQKQDKALPIEAVNPLILPINWICNVCLEKFFFIIESTKIFI